jgi:hypothetical protein
LDAFDDESTTVGSESSITVGHEDLFVSGGGNLHFTRRSSPSQTVTNVPAEYI